MPQRGLSEVNILLYILGKNEKKGEKTESKLLLPLLSFSPFVNMKDRHIKVWYQCLRSLVYDTLKP